MISSKPLRRLICCSLLFGASAFASSSPEPGDPAPDFTLTSQAGSQVSLKDYEGRWVILFFFGDHVRDDVRVEARNFQRDLAKYSSFNASIIGIGRSLPESNRDWADTNGLTFTLLSDPDQKIAEAYGVEVGGSNSARGGMYEVIVAPNGKVQLPRIVTSDFDGESDHLLACLQYFKDRTRVTQP
jgi:thioredoxin-dependent peroxiredoxin